MNSVSIPVSPRAIAYQARQYRRLIAVKLIKGALALIVFLGMALYIAVLIGANTWGNP